MSEVEANAPERTMFDCGCSVLKVRAGLCSIYAPDGTERPAERALAAPFDLAEARRLAGEAMRGPARFSQATTSIATGEVTVVDVDYHALASNLLAACDEIERLRRQAFIDPDGAGSILERVTQERDEARAALSQETADRQSFEHAHDAWTKHGRSLEAEIKRSRPVVEAAREIVGQGWPGRPCNRADANKLRDVVLIYERATGASS